MKGDTTAPAPSRCCLVLPRPGSRLSVAPVAQARRVKRLRERSRPAALDRGRHPEPPGIGAPNWGTRTSERLDVRQKSPERQTCGGPGTRRGATQCEGNRSGGELDVSNLGVVRGAPPLHPRPTRQPRAPAPARALQVPRGRNERDTPHHGLRQTRRSSLNCRRGIGHRSGFRQPVPPEVSGIVCCIAGCRRRGGRCDSILHLRECPTRGPALWFPGEPGNQKVGRKLYRSHSQLSITQRVRHASPGARTPVVERPVVDPFGTPEPLPRQRGESLGTLRPVHDGVSRWSP